MSEATDNPASSNFGSLKEFASTGMQEFKVGQNEFKYLDIQPRDNSTYVFRTIARIGCDAILVLRTDQSGGNHVLLTHYDPGHKEDHMNVIKQYFPEGDGELFSLLVMTGSDSQRNSDIISYLAEKAKVPTEVVVTESAQFTADTIAKLMRNDPLAHQIIFTKGYNGDPSCRRVTVPKEFVPGQRDLPKYSFEKILKTSLPKA